MYCPQCSSSNRAYRKLCRKCGYDLTVIGLGSALQESIQELQKAQKSITKILQFLGFSVIAALIFGLSTHSVVDYFRVAASISFLFIIIFGSLAWWHSRKAHKLLTSEHPPTGAAIDSPELDEAELPPSSVDSWQPPSYSQEPLPKQSKAPDDELHAPENEQSKIDEQNAKK